MSVLVLTTSYPRYDKDDKSIFIERLTAAIGMKLVESGEDKPIVIVPLDDNEPLSETRDAVEIKRFKYGIFKRGKVAFGIGLLQNIQKAPLLALQLPMLILMMVQSALASLRSKDVIIAHWIIAGWAAYIISLIRNTSYVVALRGSDIPLIRRKLGAIVASPVLKRAHKVITVADFVSEDIRLRFNIPPDRVVTIVNGVDFSMPSKEQVKAFAAAHGFEVNKKYILSVATVHPLKRQHLILEALPHLPEFSLILCGSTVDEEYHSTLLNRAKKLKIEDRLHIMGQVPPEDVRNYLALGAIFCSASLSEGRPNAVVEALAMNLPVLLSDIEAHRELVSKLENNAIATLISDMSSDKIARQIEQLESASRDFHPSAGSSPTFYSWSECARRYLNASGLNY